MCLLSVVRSTTGTPSGNLKNHGSNSLPSTLSSTLTRISSFYPKIKYLVSLHPPPPPPPPTSYTAERSFSGPSVVLNVSKLSLGLASNERLSILTLLHMHQAYPLTSKKSLMGSPDIIPGEFNFMTSLDSYPFIVLLHFFLQHFTRTSTNRFEVIW